MEGGREEIVSIPFVADKKREERSTVDHENYELSTEHALETLCQTCVF